jgi:4-hydroxybenzoate polyprenyltransferase
MSLRAGSNLIAGLALTLLLGWRVLPPFWRALRDVSPQTVRHAVRTGVLSLVLLDAAIGGVYAGAPYGLLILAMAPIAWLLARPFAVT